MFGYKFMFVFFGFCLLFGAERKKFVKQEDNTLRDVMFYKFLI